MLDPANPADEGCGPRDRRRKGQPKAAARRRACCRGETATPARLIADRASRHGRYGSGGWVRPGLLIGPVAGTRRTASRVPGLRPEPVIDRQPAVQAPQMLQFAVHALPLVPGL